jgi:hypothetical protein
LDNIYLDDYLISKIAEDDGKRGSSCKGSLVQGRRVRGKTAGERVGQL